MPPANLPPLAAVNQPSKLFRPLVWFGRVIELPSAPLSEETVAPPLALNVTV